MPRRRPRSGSWLLEIAPPGTQRRHSSRSKWSAIPVSLSSPGQHGTQCHDFLYCFSNWLGQGLLFPEVRFVKRPVKTSRFKVQKKVDPLDPAPGPLPALSGRLILIGTGGSSVFWIKYQNPPVRKILLRTSLLPRGETPSQKGPRVAATISLDSARSQPFEACGSSGARSGYADETLHGFLSNSTSRPGDDTRYR